MRQDPSQRAVCVKGAWVETAAGKRIAVEVLAMLLCQKAYDCSNPETSLALNLS